MSASSGSSRRQSSPPNEWGDYPRPDNYGGRDDDPMFDAALAHKVIYGIQGHNGHMVGGHGYGNTPVGKDNTEFPRHWTNDDIAAAFYETLEEGQRENLGDGSWSILHTARGVLCFLQFNVYRRPVEESVVFYPRHGAGTIQVRWRNSKRTEKELK